MSKEKQSPTVSRRKFLQISALAVPVEAAIFLSACTRLSWPLPPVHPTPHPEKKTSIVDQIMAFEKTQEDQPLTFEQAKNYAGLLAEFFVESGPVQMDSGEIASSIFILRPSNTNQPESTEAILAKLRDKNYNPLTHDSVAQFAKDYPHIELTDEEARQVIFLTRVGKSNGVVLNGKAFVVLPDTTGHQNTKLAGLVPIVEYQWQYTDLTATPMCQVETPIVRFRSDLLHEMVHLDVESTPWTPLEEEILAADRKIASPRMGQHAIFARFDQEIISAQKRHFSVRVEKRLRMPDSEPSSEKQHQLTEFITDHLSLARSTRHGLPFTIARGTPIMHANFARLLQQADISQDSLYQLYRQSQIMEFLEKIAQATQNIELPTTEDQLKFALRYFSFWHLPEGLSNEPDEKSLLPYVPTLDPNWYNYVDPNNAGAEDGPKSGCLA